MSSLPPSSRDSESDAGERPRDPFVLGRWIVDPDRLLLRSGDEEVRLQQKEMLLLWALIDRDGRPVSSEDLRQAVWGDQAITDGAAKNLVWQLRRTLGETAEDPDLIETVPGVGYRLTATPRPIEGTSAPSLSPADAEESKTLLPHEQDAEPAPRDRAPRDPTGPRRALLVAGVVALLAALGAIYFLARTDPEPPSEPTASGPRAVSGLAGREAQIDLDPQGRFLLFAWAEAVDQPTDLYRFDLRDPEAEPVPLTRTDELFEGLGRWSWDGRRIAFVRAESERLVFSIRVMSSVGGGSEEILRLRSDRIPHVAWEVGDQALFVTFRGEGGSPSRVHRLALEEGAELEPLLPPADDAGWDQHPATAPDGRRLALVRKTSPHAASIRVLDLASGEERVVVDSLVHASTLVWDPTGEHLLFTARIDGPGAAWTVPADGSGEPSLYPPTAAALDLGEITVGGGVVACEQSVYDVDVLRFDGLDRGRLDPSAEGVPQARTDRVEKAFRPSPDGREAVFISDGSGTLELTHMRADGSLRRLPVEGLYAGSWPRWSPDGSLVALSVRRGEQHDLALVRPADGSVRQLTDTPVREMSPAWSPDGTALYFIMLEDGERWALWRQELWQPDERRRVAEGAQSVAVLADGRILYSYKGEGLMLLENEEAEPRLLPVDTGPSEWNNWHATLDGVYTLRLGSKTVRYYSFEDGSTVDVVELDQTLTTHGLSVSADGRSLYAAVIVRDTSRVLVVGGPRVGSPRVGGPAESGP